MIKFITTQAIRMVCHTISQSNSDDEVRKTTNAIIDRQKNYHTYKTFADNMNVETSYPSRKDDRSNIQDTNQKKKQ